MSSRNKKTTWLTRATTTVCTLARARSRIAGTRWIPWQEQTHQHQFGIQQRPQYSTLWITTYPECNARVAFLDWIRGEGTMKRKREDKGSKDIFIIKGSIIEFIAILVDLWHLATTEESTTAAAVASVTGADCGETEGYSNLKWNAFFSPKDNT